MNIHHHLLLDSSNWNSILFTNVTKKNCKRFNHGKTSLPVVQFSIFVCFFPLLQVQKHLIPLQSTTSQHHLHIYERGAVGHPAFRSFCDPSDTFPLAQGDNPRRWQQQQRWGPVAAPALLFFFICQRHTGTPSVGIDSCMTDYDE